MQMLRPFQIGLLGIFGLIAFISLIVISSYQGVFNNREKIYGDRVVIWGTLDEKAFTDLFFDVSTDDKDFSVVKYFRKDERVFKEELVDAIAEGNGPDAIVLSSNDLVSLRSKLLPIPYETLSQRSFRDSYIDGSGIYARSDGVFAVPFFVDPLVLYWNRDILSSYGFALAPPTWEDLTDLTQGLTLRDPNRNVTQSTIAFGEFQNIRNAKETMLMLLLQSGSRMVEEENGSYEVLMDQSIGDTGRNPFVSSIDFYSNFSNANSPLYSWNRSMEEDRLAFLGEKLALYFGFGSEYNDLRADNPNFNFDSARVPQGSSASVLRNYGEFYGIALLQTSRNPQGTYQAIMKLNSPDILEVLADRLALAPARRELIARGATDPHRAIVYSEGLIARAWLDPDEEKSKGVFSLMIEDIVSGRQKVSGAVYDAISRLNLLF